MSTVVLYGASGITGSLTARQLVARGISLVLAGRSERRLAALRDELAIPSARPEIRVAEMTDRLALGRAFAGASVVVSAAGPFSESGSMVLGAAIDAGAHYLDSTGEQAFTKVAYAEYDGRARERGVCAVPGCAFEIAPGDFAAEEAATRILDGRERSGSTLDEVVVAYWVRGFGTSPGTRLSAIEQLGRAGYLWKDGRLVVSIPAEEKRRFDFPEPIGLRTGLSFPSSECLSVPRHVAVRRVQTYLVVPSGQAALVHAGRRWLGPLLRSPLRRIATPLARARPGPSEATRGLARFCVLAEARLGERIERVAVTGRDVYGFTAIMLADAVEQMLAPGFARSGVLAPAQAFDTRAAIERLSRKAGIVMQ